MTPERRLLVGAVSHRRLHDRRGGGGLARAQPRARLRRRPHAGRRRGARRSRSWRSGWPSRPRTLCANLRLSARRDARRARQRRRARYDRGLGRRRGDRPVARRRRRSTRCRCSRSPRAVSRSTSFGRGSWLARPLAQREHAGRAGPRRRPTRSARSRRSRRRSSCWGSAGTARTPWRASLSRVSSCGARFVW